MYVNRYSDNKVVKITFYLLIFFLFFDYVFAFTVYKSQICIYLFTIFNLLSIIYCALKYGIKSNIIVSVWIPYLGFHIVSLVFNGNIANVPYWIISLILLCLPLKIIGVFRPVLFVCIGLFFAGGVFFQYLFPDVYSIAIFPLFINEASDFIESSMANEFGFSGFSPQTGKTAYLLLICQSVLLAFWKENRFLKNNVYRYVILFIFMLAIFLTGKRTLSAISIFVFLISIYVYGSGNKTRDVFVLALLLLCCWGILQYFIDNIDLYSDNIFLKRFADSYNSASDGGDVTSGRTFLYRRALVLFEQQPILGVGAGNFIKISGMGMAVHNTYLQVLCEEGILRFILFIMPVLMSFVKTVKMIVKNSNVDIRCFLILSLFIQIVFVLYSFTGNTIENSSNFVLYFMSVGIVAGLYNKRFNQVKIK